MDPGRAHDRGLLSRSSSKDYTMMMGLFTPSAWMMLAGFSRRMFKKLRLRMIGYNGVPGAPVGKFPDALWIFQSNLFWGLKFDQASQRITGKLSEQTPLGARYSPRGTLNPIYAAFTLQPQGSF